jgi:uncharacterized phage protein gp47/JayE
MYEDQTEPVIKQRMLDAVPSDLDKQEGSFIYDGISPAAIELALSYIELDRVLRLGFAQTTYGQYLDYRAGEHGLTRKEAVKATCNEVEIFGSNGTSVASGTVLATKVGVQFKITSPVTIGVSGSAIATIEALVAGSGGNVPAGTITEIPISIPGVTSVINNIPASGGVDTESDSALLARLLEKVRLPTTSGNTAHYLEWAKSVTGVGDAKVFPIWDGPGTVKVVVIDSDKQPVEEAIRHDVADYIESVRPIGATVTVESATGLEIDVSANLTLDTGPILEDIQEEFETALTEYLKGIAFKQSYVSFAQIGSLLLDIVGVLDYADLTVNAGTANITIGNTEVPVKGTVLLDEI